MLTIRDLPTEIHAHICVFLSPISRILAQCAWAGFARAFSLNHATPSSRLTTFDKAWQTAAMSGDIITMEMFIRIGRTVPTFIAQYAILDDMIETLRWSHEHENVLYAEYTELALRRGALECLKYLRSGGKHSLSASRMFILALEHGRIDCAEYVRRTYGVEDIQGAVFRCITPNNAIAATKYLCSIGMPPTRSQIDSMIYDCGDEFVKYLCSSGVGRGEDITFTDRPGRHHCSLDAMKSLVTAGYTISIHTNECVLRADCPSCYEWMLDYRGMVPNKREIIMMAAIKCLKWAHRSGLIGLGPPDLLCAMEQEIGDDIVKYLTRIGVRSEAAYNSAVHGGASYIVYWLMKHADYPIGLEVFQMEQQYQFHKIIKLMHKRQQPWPPGTAIMAASKGLVHSLKYMHKHGEIIDFAECAAAVIAEHDKCIRSRGYMYDTCYDSGDDLDYYVHTRHADTLAWIKYASGLNMRLNVSATLI